jgi:phosphate transport system substrate-binding protein
VRKLTSILTVAGLGAALFAGEVMVKGSDTMLNLTQRLAEEFAAVRPDATVSVAGGGSGVGINAITNGECDIANASRAIKSKEVSAARANGVNPTQIVVAMDALSVIVNSNNPIQELTIAQVGAIYRGEVANWNQVGGPNQRVVLYGRQPNSGTFVFFREEAVKGEYATSMRQMNGNAQIVEGVKADPGGIGYVGLGYIKDAEGFKAVAIARNDGEEYVAPTDEAKVKAGGYPLTRPLFQYTNGRPNGDARAFIEFELSPAGQQVVQAEGFLPVTSDYAAKNQAVLR